MKTNLIITLSFIFLLMGFTDLSAQKRWGLKGGIDRTNVRFYHPYSTSRIAFQAGAFGYFPLNYSETLYLQPEVMYQQAGEKNIGNYLINGQQVIADEKYYIDYITVPVMLKSYFSDHYSTFFGEIGPEFAFKINQKSSSNLSESRAIDDYGVNGDEVADFDFRISLGLGFSYERQWELNFRYTFGITDVYPKTIGENQAKTNNNHLFALSLAYIFD